LYCTGTINYNPSDDRAFRTIRVARARFIASAGVIAAASVWPTSGARSPVEARFSYVWKKEGGSWKISHHHSSVRPAGA